jgi:hypothetical protein
MLTEHVLVKPLNNAINATANAIYTGIRVTLHLELLNINNK